MGELQKSSVVLGVAFGSRCIASDLGNKVSGMRGRLIAQSLILIIEGVLLFPRVGGLLEREAGPPHERRSDAS